MSKQPDIIVDPKDFPLYLKARMGRGTVADLAAELGVTPKLVYMLLTGERTPSGAILKKLGLETVFRLKAAISDKK